jgi:hypothetical protein
MATADVAKEAVFDGRIVQNPARYAVEKGGLSLTNSPYNAISASASQHTYNINVPSQNVWVDRAIDWATAVYVKFFVTVAGAGSAGLPVIVPGQELSLSAFPLQSLVGTATATINDTSVTINTDTVLREVLRLTDYAKNRLTRTCPTQLDRYHYGVDAFNAINNPGSDYAGQTAATERPNGAWFDFEFVAPTPTLAGATVGTPLSGASNYPNTGAAGAGSPANVSFVAGIPVQAPAGADAQYLIGIKFRCVEKLVLSPFIFADSAQWETGLFGINNIQIVLNMKASLDRLFRITAELAAQPDVPLKTLSGVSYLTPAGATSPFENPRVNVQYVTPSLDLPLPAKSVVPYMEFPRYLTNFTVAGPVQPFATISSVQSQTIVLPQIPDMLIIYAKPQVYDVGAPEWYLPIERISVNFDNFAGLLSSHSREQLYQMSVHNGLDMDFDEWAGRAIRAGKANAITAPAAGIIGQYRQPTVGGFLLLKPGQDITLQAGQAPGLIGNFTLQYQVDLVNASYEVLNGEQFTLFTIAVNSGFFETVAGSSRIVKGVLSEADILQAPPAPEGTGEAMSRLVGHGIMDRMGSFLTKAKAAYSTAKPVLSAIREALPSEGRAGQVKGALSMAGMGMSGGVGPAGGGKKSLSMRLM